MHLVARTALAPRIVHCCCARRACRGGEMAFGNVTVIRSSSSVEVGRPLTTLAKYTVCAAAVLVGCDSSGQPRGSECTMADGDDHTHVFNQCACGRYVSTITRGTPRLSRRARNHVALFTLCVRAQNAVSHQWRATKPSRWTTCACNRCPIAI